MEARRYRFVYFHKQYEEWVWHRKGHKACGHASTQAEAAKMAAKAYGVPVAQLLLRKPQRRQLRPPQRQYRYVTYHARSKTWVAQTKKLGTIGSSTCQDTAAKLVANALEVPLDTLRLAKRTALRPLIKRPSASSATSTAPRPLKRPSSSSATSTALRPPSTALRLAKNTAPKPTSSSSSREAAVKDYFKVMWAVYRGEAKGASVAAQAKLPGDLEHLLRGDQFVEVKQCHPELLMPYLLAKYGPHRDALAGAAKVMAGQRAHTEPAEWLRVVLEKSLQLLDGVALGEEWTLNVGRGTSHHSGLVSFANRALGMLKACSVHTKGALHLGNAGRCFRLVRTESATLKRLAAVATFGHAMAKAKAPRTVEEWASEVAALQAAAKDVPGLSGGPASYRALWIIRALLVCLMRRAKAPGLRMDPTCSVSSFAKLFPDQRGWISKLVGQGREQQPMAKVLSDLRRHPVRDRG